MIKLTTLGSGTFFVNKKVSATAFLLEIENTKILIDCGPGTLVKLSEAGYSPTDIDYVLITHLHGDHTSDLFPFFMYFRLDDAFSKHPVTKHPTLYGPKLLDKFMLDYSHITQLHSYENWGKIKIKKLEPEFKLGKITVKPRKVVHRAFGIDAEAYGFRFEFDKKVIAFSGDAAKCPGIQNLCKNADLFVCDCSFPKSREKNDIHMNTTEIGEIAKEGNVKELLLSHFYPQFSDIDLVGEIKEVYKGKIRMAKDLEFTEID